MPESPIPNRWSSTTKLVVALVFAALLLLMAIQFRYLLSPLLAAVVLAYIFQPSVLFLSRKLRITNRFAVAIIYILFVLVILGLITWGGFALSGQVSGLINYLSKNVSTWPDAITTFLSTPFKIGSTTINLNTMDLTQFNTQLIEYIQQLLGTLGSGIANLGKSALSVVGWTLFSILVSFFILSESDAGKLLNINLLGHNEDQNKIGKALDTIWNNYLRRQLLICFITLLVYSGLLGMLGVNYFFGLALMAAFARFIPYLGPLITWIVYALVAGFASTPIFGMSPLAYAIMVVVISYLVDVFLDYFVATKLMANALKLHPAAILVASLVGLNIFGLIGVMLAAPILATLILFFKYARYKMADEDPWEHIQLVPVEKKSPASVQCISRIAGKINTFFKKIFSKKKPNEKRKQKE